MEYTMAALYKSDKKAAYTRVILRRSPEWFEVEESIQKCINTVCKYSYWAAFDNDDCVGFFSGTMHYNKTGDIYVY
jgi:hypothetical protein